MTLNPKDIIASPEKFNRSMINRNESIMARDVEIVYLEWKDTNAKLESISHELNKLSKDFNKENQARCKELAELKKVCEKDASDKRDALDQMLYKLPNIIDDSVPLGKNSDDNVALEYHGAKPQILHPMHHEDIASKMGFWHRDEAVNMSGSRFIMLTDKLAKLERTLVQFALSENTKAGFMEVSVPFIVKQSSMYNSGQLPKFLEDHFAFDDYGLISTGEIPLVNYYANKTIDENMLPVKLTTHTPCFRQEAGSLGKDTKGLIRLHQFHKVELVAFTTAIQSEDMHMYMLNHIKHLLNLLGLHYRVVDICSGDIGFTASRQFDVEVWMAGQDKYVEVASCSNCKDFQARRMKAKYTGSNGKSELLHTLNGTAIACGRIIAAILEHYCHNGEFILPEALRGYYV